MIFKRIVIEHLLLASHYVKLQATVLNKTQSLPSVEVGLMRDIDIYSEEYIKYDKHDEQKYGLVLLRDIAKPL